MGGLSGDKATDLCQQRDECRLPQQGGLTAHIGPGDDHDLCLLRVAQDVIGDVALPEGELLLDDGVTPRTDVDARPLVHDGADVAVRDGRLRQGREAVQARQLLRVLLQGLDVAGDALQQRRIELRLEAGDLVLRP